MVQRVEAGADTERILRRSGARLATVLAELANVPCPLTRSARIVFEDELQEDRSVGQLRLRLERLEKAVDATLTRQRQALLELRNELSTVSGATALDVFRIGLLER